MDILPSQKNGLFELIIKHNFVPDTEIQIYNCDYDFFELRYRNKPYYIKFSETLLTNRKGVQLCPSFDKPLYVTDIKDNWSNYMTSIEWWLGYLKGEINQPDKWDDFLKLTKGLEIPITEQDNNKFTYNEVKEIESKLNFLKGEISKLGLLEPEVQRLNIGIDYLCEKAKDSTKRDWMFLVVGTFFTIFVEQAIKSEIANHIWIMVAHLFNNLPLLK